MYQSTLLRSFCFYSFDQTCSFSYICYQVDIWLIIISFFLTKRYRPINYEDKKINVLQHMLLAHLEYNESPEQVWTAKVCGSLLFIFFMSKSPDKTNTITTQKECFAEANKTWLCYVYVTTSLRETVTSLQHCVLHFNYKRKRFTIYRAFTFK